MDRDRDREAPSPTWGEFLALEREVIQLSNRVAALELVGIAFASMLCGIIVGLCYLSAR